jgi:hypothetical protein
MISEKKYFKKMNLLFPHIGSLNFTKKKKYCLFPEAINADSQLYLQIVFLGIQLSKIYEKSKNRNKQKSMTTKIIEKFIYR